MRLNQIRLSTSIGSAAALAGFALACVTAANAQVAATSASGDSNLFAAVTSRPMDLASLAGVDYSSSTSSVDTSSSALTSDPGSLTGEGGMQPPPRRRYGRPRYNDSSHNSDGSNKYVFEAAAGLTLPVGNTFKYDNTSYAFQVGGGRQFNKHVAVLAQFDYDNFGLGKATLDNQQTLYDLGCSAVAGNCISGLDGNSHVWSFTLNPTYTFYSGDKYGAYVVAGIGYYHKVTNFTVPETEEVLTFLGPEDYTANAIIDHYTSNAVGYNGGLGLTYKFSRFADERFFIEARYVFVDNSQRTGETLANSTTAPYGTISNPGSTYTGSNYYPANSNRTGYVPVKVGIRF